MRCPACSHEIAETAKFCRYCGAAVTAPPKTKKCPRCGAENAVTARFCRVDGLPFDEAPAAPAAGASAQTEAPSEPAAVTLEPAAAGIVCPQCGTLNAPGAKFCKDDGYPLTASATHSTGVLVEPGSVICPTCGATNSAAARFCRKDGTPLGAPQVEGVAGAAPPGPAISPSPPAPARPRSTSS